MRCLECGKEITRTDRFKFCCPDCKEKYDIKVYMEKKKMQPKKYKRVCPTCGKEFETNRINQHFCSTACHYQKKEHKPIKCRWCGKEFTPRDTQKYCSPECSHTVNNKRSRMSQKIDSIANKYGFEVKNKDKIVKAKLLVFAGGDINFCPCDSQNPERYCGSKQCLQDIGENGHCHCSLFWLKNTADNVK